MTKPAHARHCRIACLAALSTVAALPLSAVAASPDAAIVLARAVVPDEQLEPMRGGLDLGSMIGRFAIERIVRVDGQTVARTQLILERLDGLSRGQLPDARLLGNLANLVQIGDANHTTAGPESAPALPPAASNAASPASTPAGSTLRDPTPPTLTSPAPAPAAQTQPVSSGTVSTPNTAGGMGNDWGSMLAQGVALANGDESNRPVPVNVGTMPSGPGGAPTSSAPPPAPSPAPAPLPQAGGVPVVQPVAPIAVPTISITIPVGGGRSVVVSGIPDGPALATSIQNSVQATRIETETRIDAALSSLSALRSLNFAAQLRQQAIDAAR